jgi:cell filamentation protein
MPESSDPYTYPGTEVLRNIPGIRDPQSLAAFEANATTVRLAELDAAPLKGRFDVAHLKAIHKYIFQDVYSWAGEFRTVNVSKGGSLFGAWAFVEPALDNVLLKLATEEYLNGADLNAFAQRAGFYLGEINAVHAFREGNGRAQREFIRELGIEAGFLLDWSRTGRQQLMAASRESFSTGDSSSLADVIRGVIS